jgi:hypothetical protein
MGLAEEWEKKLNESFIHQHVNHEEDHDLLDFVPPSFKDIFHRLMLELDEIQHTLLEALRDVSKLQAAKRAPAKKAAKRTPAKKAAKRAPAKKAAKRAPAKKAAKRAPAK